MLIRAGRQIQAVDPCQLCCDAGPGQPVYAYVLCVEIVTEVPRLGVICVADRVVVKASPTVVSDEGSFGITDDGIFLLQSGMANNIE